MKTNRLITAVFAMGFLMFTMKGLAQTCTINVSSYKICLGSSVQLSYTSTGSVTSNQWDFGDGGTDTAHSTAHVYKTPGNYTVKLFVRFSNNTTCTTTVTQPVQVFDLPRADFKKSADTICLSDPLCLTNISQPGSSNAPMVKITFLFGDGAIQYNNNTPCHTYTTPGSYFITLEVQDSNGCIARMEKPVVVIDMQAFITTSIVGCSRILFNNPTTYPWGYIKRYYWDFGDGTKDSSISSFYSVTHTYSRGSICPMMARIYVESRFGCIISKQVNVCPVYNFNIHITENKKSMCWKNNFFSFNNPTNPGATMSWAYKKEGTAVYTNSFYGSNAFYSFPDCGRYIVMLTVKANGCDTTAFDTVDVEGPHAVIEKDTLPPHKIIDKYLCTPDTVHLTPLIYQSSHCSPNIKRLWDFGDFICPQCTTDNRNGINVNINCRWSKDSMNVKHKYQDTGCYQITLILKDTITQCADSAELRVVIGRPDLSKLVVTGKPCLGAPQLVDLSKVRPSCDAEEFWFNRDTLCQGNKPTSWIRLQYKNFSYQINSPCVGDSVVTGFVLKNGNCYDTLFLVKHFPRLIPYFNVTTTRACAPYTSTATLVNPIQHLVMKATWDWGDGTTTLDSPVVNGVILSQSHTYYTRGLYSIKLRLWDGLNSGPGDCFYDTVCLAGVGYYINFVPKSNNCINKLVVFDRTVYNYVQPYNGSNPYSFFAGTYRWYYGDGTSDTIGSHRYNAAGRYRVKLLVTDTNGCQDSLEKWVTVNEIKAGFTWIPKILVCGQIVQFTDTSSVVDSSGILPADKIVGWTWDFGDQRTKSNLQNPAHAYFVYGDFHVKLKVVTQKGCEDSVEVIINIKGPHPQFELLSDSIGCVPFTVKLRNLSTSCDRNIIYFGDPAGNNQVINNGDTVQFTYNQPGVYELYIFGESSFINPNTGSQVYCSSWYPDRSNPNVQKIRVQVLARPPVSFTAPDTICVNTAFNMINHSNRIYDRFTWYYGDTTNETHNRPDTNAVHVFKHTGTYSIWLKPDYIPVNEPLACPDSFEKKITVIDLKANFTMDQSKSPVVLFQNTSVNADSWLWDFGHPQSGAKNISRLKDPEHDFLNDTGWFNICLVANNKYGCLDSVCQPFHNDNYRLLIIPNVFTINNDGLNDVFDIDIHGEDYYHLTIYNRWGMNVYESSVDGLGNDGNNWNGKLMNTGAECPDGVYYFKLNYSFRGENPQTYTGAVTLIR